ncbi:HAMP domain-containing sensor histidine kinase [Terrabacter koreensis]
MSSSRPSDAPVEKFDRPERPDLPDPADLPDADGAPAPDLRGPEVGFTDEPADQRTDDTRTYAVPLAPAAGFPSDAASEEPAEDQRTLRERLADAQDRVRPWAAWTLRAKLVASMLALFTILSLVTGALTVVTLERQLTSQLDDQLRTSMQRFDRPGARLPELGADDNRSGPARGPGDEGLSVWFPDDSAASGRATTGQGRSVALNATQLQQLASAGLGSMPIDIQLGGQVGEYRVTAVRLLLGDGSTGTFVAGLPLEPRARTIAQMTLTVISTVAAGIILVALIGTWLVRRNLEPLRRVAATATKVSRMPLHSGKVALAERVDAADTDTRTEVGQVGAAFNEMLDHVDEALNARHQSEQRVRQFVADASHELRTPLASIKGYAELSRREPNAVPQTVTHAMGRIESEANRMSSLVEDLLLLARLDAGRPLEEAPVDVSMLVINAVSDAHAASPGHRWDLDLPPEPVEVRGDAARLHQVVANLLGNARTHTPDGTRVTTSVRPEGEWVRVAVHDDGPGVPETLQPNVFERFARGDDARVRAGGSTGLGLSIVAAVSKAHGGRVELESKPGDTTFSLLLPAAV